jgi:hypothetical protein
MNTKEVISALNKKGIMVSRESVFYTGVGGRDKYSIVGSPKVDSKTSYMSIPTQVNTHGFISCRGKLQEFFYHTDKGFNKTKCFNEFLTDLEKYI